MQTLLLVFALISSAYAQIPEDAKKALDRLPGKQLSIEFIVAKAFVSSDSVRAIHAQSLAIESSYWQSLVRTETSIGASATYSKNDNRNASLFDPRNAKLFEANASKYFSTGTLLGVQLSELNSTLQPQNTFMPADKASARITLSQQLLKDGFGSMTRRQLQAGKLLKETSELTYKQALQDWTLDLIGVYYGAWLSQAQLRSTRSDLERRQRLVRITKLKLNRGTAERPDLLQVESAHLQARAAFDQSTHDLQKTWRELVTNLKLPEHWIDIPAEQLPLTLDDPQKPALALCSEKSNIDKSRDVALAQKLWSKRVAATEKIATASKNGMLPELAIEGTYGSTGTVGEFPARSEDAFGMKNPEWTIGLRFKMPLGRYAEKAQLAQDMSQYQQTLALSDKAKIDHLNGWESGCAQLKTLVQNQKLLTEAVTSLTARASLEERRFDIGRTTTFNVILAGDEKALAELRLNQIKASANQAAWEILKLNGEVEPFLEKSVKSLSTLDIFKDKNESAH